MTIKGGSSDFEDSTRSNRFKIISARSLSRCRGAGLAEMTMIFLQVRQHYGCYKPSRPSEVSREMEHVIVYYLDRAGGRRRSGTVALESERRPSSMWIAG
jgi:hypothetical protein